MTYHLVVNRDAGRARSDELLPVLLRHFRDVDFHLCPNPSPAHLSAPGAHAVVAVGGDGTVSRVVNALGDFPVPLGIVPAGTANDFADALGIPRDLDLACEVVRARIVRTVDVLRVNGRAFVTCGGLGVPAAVAARANRWKESGSPLRGLCRSLGPGTYVLAAGLTLVRRQPLTCLVRCEGRTLRAEVFALLISNQARFGGHFRVSAGARNGDGLLDLCEIEEPRDWAGPLGVLVGALRGTVEARADVHALRGRRVSILCDRPTVFFGDGEVLAVGRRFEVETRPAGLQVLAPEPVVEAA